MEGGYHCVQVSCADEGSPRDRDRRDARSPGPGLVCSVAVARKDRDAHRAGAAGRTRPESREYVLLEVLSRQHDGEGGHLQMKQVVDAVTLSPSATTRLVTRLEDRGLLSRYLCLTDRRGIYTDVTPTGLTLLADARPTHDAALREALAEAGRDTLLRPLVEVVEAASPTARS